MYLVHLAGASSVNGTAFGSQGGSYWGFTASQLGISHLKKIFHLVDKLIYYV